MQCEMYKIKNAFLKALLRKILRLVALADIAYNLLKISATCILFLQYWLRNYHVHILVFYFLYANDLAFWYMIFFNSRMVSLCSWFP